MVISRTLKIILPAVFLLAASLRADVTIKSTTSMEGLGGLMNSEGAELKMLSGMKAKSETTNKSTSKTMKFLGGGKAQDNAAIIRVDKELFWNLNVKDKEYTEKTFAEVAAEFKNAIDKATKQKNSQEKKSENKKVDKRDEKNANDSVTIKTEFKVTHTGKKQKIAGYETEESILTGTVTGKNNQSGESGAMILTMDLWLTQDVPGQEEYVAFYKAMSSKLGYEMGGQEGLGKSLLAMGVDPTELEKEASKLKGFPMMTVMTMTAAADSTQPQGGKVEHKKSKDEAGTSDNSSQPNVLSSLFGKKKDKSKDEKTDKGSESSEAADSGPAVLMKYTGTVTEINRSPIAPSEFEVPGSFKKK